MLDGEVVIVGDGGLDFEALLLRIHPAASRVKLLAEQTPSSYVAWDLLALGNEDLRAKRPFEFLAAWGLAAEARAAWLSARAKGPGREPATIDPATQAALDSWERTR